MVYFQTYLMNYCPYQMKIKQTLKVISGSIIILINFIFPPCYLQANFRILTQHYTIKFSKTNDLFFAKIVESYVSEKNAVCETCKGTRKSKPIIGLVIIENLKKDGKITDKNYIICNGFKREEYVTKIQNLINNGHKNCIPIIDNYEEIDLLTEGIRKKINIGIRIASEEEPKFEFYTSRLGIGYKNIVDFYRRDIKENKKVNLKMLHFF